MDSRPILCELQESWYHSYCSYITIIFFLLCCCCVILPYYLVCLASLSIWRNQVVYINYVITIIRQQYWLFCRLQEGVFVNLRRLKTLYLHHNDIASIGPRVFDESANLTSLSTIDLSHNDMTELEPWPIIRAQQRPMSVYLRFNRITKFTNALQWSFSCNSPRVFATRLDVSRNDIKHITDVIDGWNITEPNKGISSYYYSHQRRRKASILLVSFLYFYPLYR